MTKHKKPKRGAQVVTASKPLAPPRVVQRLLKPIQEFMHHSASGGIALIVATIIALVLANSPWRTPFDDLLHTYVSVSVGPYELKETLAHWINDGLMAIFFLLVGLEIKREVLVGELSDLKAAALPIAAAIGGVAVPALIYLAFNMGKAGQPGWGVPMATDIAFALGCMALLGSRVPFALKVFLTAVAIVDDLVAVLVIAFFYSGGIQTTPLLFAFGILGLMVIAAVVLHIHKIWFYLVLGLFVWLGFLLSGVHATIAGVLVALTIPSRYRINESLFTRLVDDIMAVFRSADTQPTEMLTDETQQKAVHALEKACEQVQAPLQRLEHALHMPVMLGIMPIFALANAAVPLTGAGIEGDAVSVMLGIIGGLVIGKPVGILFASWLAVKSGVSTLPTGVTWGHMLGAGMLAGIGFTMSLFIAALGLNGTLLDPAKMAILIASIIAGAAGMIMLSRQPRVVEEVA